MKSNKVNNVINLLINEIKVVENKKNAKELSIEKGKNVAKSLLNEHCLDKKTLKFLSDREQNDNHSKREEEINEKKIDNTNEENANEEKSDDENSISEIEKKALEFYDEKIDSYNEEYVNKKYRFCTKDCDSSLCCCACFSPVCYQSQRHEHYISQYRSLYAVNIKIDEEKVLYEDEINSKVEKKVNDNMVLNEKKSEKEKSVKYHAVFCINCDNHIAYFEIKKKLFHFFDVLPD